MQISESFTAMRFSTPEKVTKAPMSDVASMRSPAVTRSMPDTFERWAMTMAG